MLCAAIHLSRQGGGEGWFQKTQSQWEELTYLSRNEQETARLKLKQFPFWQEKLTGIPAQLSYRVDIDQLSQLRFKKQNPKFPRKNGFVYLMRNNRNLFTKIGFSKNPSFRERTLQSEEPDIEIIFQCPGTIELEGECHYRFSAYRVRGEWFRLSEIDIEEAKEFISREKN